MNRDDEAKDNLKTKSFGIIMSVELILSDLKKTLMMPNSENKEIKETLVVCQALDIVFFQNEGKVFIEICTRIIEELNETHIRRKKAH